MRSLAAATMIALVLAAAGCGDSEDDAADEPATTPQAVEATDGEQAEGGQAKGFALVESCGKQTGQDIFAPPPGSLEFIACLEENDAPRDTIKAWLP
jgi:hypothetical protein